MRTIIWFESITRNEAGTIKVNYFYINLSLLLRRVAIIVIIGHPISGPRLTIEPQPVWAVLMYFYLDRITSTMKRFRVFTKKVSYLLWGLVIMYQLCMFEIAIILFCFLVHVIRWMSSSSNWTKVQNDKVYSRATFSILEYNVPSKITKNSKWTKIHLIRLQMCANIRKILCSR